MNESLRGRPDCHQSKSLILTIHIGMGVMTIDHILFEKGTPATPTHSCMHTYLTFRFQTQKRQLWFDTYKNRNVQLPGLKNDSPQTSYILVTKSHHITYGQSFKLLQHLEWRRPWRLGRPNLIFFFHLKSELNEFYFFTFRFHSQS